MTPKTERWEQAAEVPLMLAAFVFLAAFAVPIIWWPVRPPKSSWYVKPWSGSHG